MRLILTFESDQAIILPRSYNHILQGWIYNQLSDPAFRLFLHNEGYRYQKRQFKLFTFSRLQGQWTLDQIQKNLIFTSPVTLQIASPLLSFMQQVAQSVLMGQAFQLGQNQIRIASLEVKNEAIPLADKTYQIATLSPIVAYSTLREGERKTTRYYHPGEAEFNQSLKENLIKKSAVLVAHGFPEYGPLEGDFTIHPLFDPLKKGSTALYYKNFFIRGYLGPFAIQCTNQAWIKTALDAGLGSKNAQGLGMVRLNNNSQ